MAKDRNAMPTWRIVVLVACLVVMAWLVWRFWRTELFAPPGQPSRTQPAAAAIADGPASPPLARERSMIEAVLAPAAIGGPARRKPDRLIQPALSAALPPDSLIDLSALATSPQPVELGPPVAGRFSGEPRDDRREQQSRGSIAMVSAPLVSPWRALQAAPRAAAAPVALERQPAQSLPAVAVCWPRPARLVAQLDALAQFDGTRGWSTAVLEALDRLHRQEALAAPAAAGILGELNGLAAGAPALAAAVRRPDLRAEVLRAGYALQRRTLVWSQINQIVSGDASPPSAPRGDLPPEDLAAVQAWIEANTYADQWRKYFLFDEYARVSQSTDTQARRELARRILARLNSPLLAPEHIEQFSEPLFTDWQFWLRRWAAEPVDYLQLVDDLETLETSRSLDDARRIALAYHALRWCDSDAVSELAETINTHYRNANVRVAISDELLNRLLPEPETVDKDVAENIAGARVFGSARSSARLRARLVPDRFRWRVGLEVEGEVESETSATRGVATFYNEGFSRYLGRKLLLVDRRGVRTWRAEADADSHTELTGIQTSLDAVPIVGWLVRAIATQQHDGHYDVARLAAEARLEEEAQARLDREVQERLAEAKSVFENQVLKPFRQLKLDPQPLDMNTTEKRLIARYRLAGGQQLGAFTPRPQAPSDSLLSVQIHETMLNNTLEQLELEGHRSDVRQLYRDLADTFQRQDLEVPDDIPDRVTIQFAAENAVRLRVEDGRVKVTLRIAEMKNRRRRWRNFSVLAYYVPDPTQLHANLVRDGVIQLIGDRLTTGDQVSLRFIFSTLLSKNRPLNIINKKLAENPALADLQVNQFTIVDGWIGVALGPQRRPGDNVAEDPSSALRR